MVSQIDYEDRAREDLAKLGILLEVEVRTFLHREVAQWDNPYRSAKQYGDLWKYKTHGVVILARIVKNYRCDETAPDEAGTGDSAQDVWNITVLAVKCGKQNI